MKKDFEGFTVKLALVDTIPVIFFTINVLCLFMIFKSPLFLIGAILCIGAGLCKVIWKLLIAIKKKNIFILSKQMRYVMPSGFLLMILAFFVDHRLFPLTKVIKMIQVPYIYGFFVFGGIGLIGMIVLAKTMDQKQAKSNWLEQVLNILIQLSFLIGVMQIAYFVNYYEAKDVDMALSSTNEVQVTKIDEGWFFDGDSTTQALIFYPGAKVEASSYAPLLKQIATTTGVDCFLVEMPCNFAIYGMNKADDLLKKYNYENWYMSGHSLGGAMACSYTKKHLDQINGLILMGAYVSTDLSDAPFDVEVIVGSNDQVINREKLAKGEDYVKSGSQVITITGGNHAFFGSYGNQKRDGNATISSQEQWNQTVEYIHDYLAKDSK